MCIKCWDAVTRHYPHLNEQERCEMLMGATCFPLGTPEEVERQLIDMKARTDGSLGAALALADKETEEAMRT